MKVSILSDLHLEISNIEFKKIDCDIMILAGDIGNGISALNFIMFHLNNGVKHVLYVMGNHEFYDTKNVQIINSNNFSLFSNQHSINPDSYEDTINSWLKLDNKIEGLHVLHNKEFIHENVRFLGTTLWTDFAKNANSMKLATYTMNDYKYITHKNDYLTPHSVFNFHIEAKKWLEKQLSDKDKINMKTIVISHHLPSYRCVSPEYYNNPKNCFYASNLDNLIKKYKIDYWIHGHTHVPVNITHLNTRIICNPRGYCYNKIENPHFNYNFIIDV